VVVRGCLGLSDHEMTEFLGCGEVRRGVSKTTTMDFWRADFGLFTESQNHRMFGVGRDLCGSPSPTPCQSRVAYSRLHRNLSRQVLNISREGDSTTSLGSLFQCSVTLRVKKFFLVFRRNFLVLFKTLVERVPWGTVLKGKEVQEVWTCFKKELLHAQEQAVPMCCKMNWRGRRPAWLNMEILLGLRKKRRVYLSWKRGQATQEAYRDLVRSCREKIRKAKAQLELSLATAVRDDDKKYFYKYLNNKKRAKDNLHPLLDLGGTSTSRMKKRLKYLITSLPQSLIIRLVIPRIVSSQCWKTGKESRIKPP